MMLPVALLLASLAWTHAAVNPLSLAANAVPKDRSPEMMAMLRLVDVSDRNFNTWWTEFTTLNNAYLAKVAGEPSLFCSDWPGLQQELNTLQEKSNLVGEGLNALGDQLSAVRTALENVEIAGKTGLNCADNPEEGLVKDLCDALDSLDDQVTADKAKLSEEQGLLTIEIAKGNDYICNCTYNDWVGAWGKCSKSCIEENGALGIKKETREVKWQPRNGGLACDDSQLERQDECDPGCCVRNCEVTDWTEWGVCPDQCWTQAPKVRRTREVEVTMYCGGAVCPDLVEEKICDNPLDIAKKELKQCNADEKSLREKNSELALKLCNPNPCQNAGTCKDGDCTCVAAFTGSFCEIEVAP